MYTQLKETYRDSILSLSGTKNHSDKKDLAELFITIADEIIEKNETSSKDLVFYNDAAVHYTYAISIAQKYLVAPEYLSQSEDIVSRAQEGIKNIHSLILKKISTSESEATQIEFNLDAITQKSHIVELREGVKSKLKTINQINAKSTFDSAASSRYSDATTRLFDEIARSMKEYFSSLIESSLGVVGPAPCQYTVVGLGSMAMKHMTPYSDLEFAIITESNEYKENSNPKVRDYFKNLSYYINFKVICLGETTIATSLYDINLDNFVKRGINFDLGGKTSLGRIDKDYDLVCTVSEMLQYLRGDYEVTEEKRRDEKLESVLENTCYIYGDKNMLKKYQTKAKEYLLSASDGHSTCFERGLKILYPETKEHIEEITSKPAVRDLGAAGDLMRFKFNAIGREGMRIDVKQEIYRLPDRLTYNLGLISGSTATINGLSAIEIVDVLLSKKIINAEAATHLKETISYANMLRLRTYSFYGQQQETMEFTPKVGGVSLSNPSFRIEMHEISEGGALFRYYYTALELHRYLKSFCESQNTPTPYSIKYFSDKTLYKKTSQNNAQVFLRLGMNQEYLKHAIEDQKQNPQKKLSPADINHIAITHANLGNFGEALNFQKRALQMSIGKYGENQENTALIYRNLGGMYFHIGKYEEGLQCQQRALDINIFLFGQDSEFTAISYHNLGNTYLQIGNYQEALKYQEKGLTIYNARGQNVNQRYMLAFNNSIGDAYSGLGDYKKALEYHKKALDISIKLYGDNAAYTAAVCVSLGSDYMISGDTENANIYLEKALMVTISLYGEHHPDTAASYNNLGYLYCKLSNFEKALECQQKGLEINQKIFGEYHSHTAASYKGIGVTFRKSGKYEDALKFHNKALEIRNKIFKIDSHSDQASSYNDVGNVYADMRNYPKALEYQQKALAINTKILGEHHPDTATSYNNLAITFMGIKKYKEALECQKKAYDIFKVTLGEENPNTVKSHNTLLIMYEKALEHEYIEFFEKRSYKEAVESAQKTLEIKKSLYGKDSHEVNTFLKFLFDHYQKIEEADLQSANLALSKVYIVEIPEEETTPEGGNNEEINVLGATPPS